MFFAEIERNVRHIDIWHFDDNSRKENGMTRRIATKGATETTGKRVAFTWIIILTLTLLSMPAGIACAADKLTESNDYSDKDFRKCSITDYSDMVDGGDVQWVWVDPSETLSKYIIKLGTVENKSQIRSKSMVESVKGIFRDTFADMDVKGAKGTLTAALCIYEAENFSAGKAWIPFVGGHQMQAGLGVEMVLRKGGNKIVAKFRHSAREGAQIEAATQEVVGDLTKYLSAH
jgi:hypothetical protein